VDRPVVIEGRVYAVADHNIAELDRHPASVFAIAAVEVKGIEHQAA
jgi:hypothetical protein